MKKKENIKKIIIWFLIGIISSLLSHYIIEILFLNYDFKHVNTQILEVRPELFLLGSIILFVIYMFFSSILGSGLLGSLLLIVTSCGFGLATKYKKVFRFETLYLNELYMIKELPFLLEVIGKRKTVMIIAILLLGFIAIFLVSKYLIRPKQNHHGKKMYLLRLVGVLTSGALLFYIGHFNYPDNAVKNTYDDYAKWLIYNQPRSYRENGFIAGFLSNLSYIPMDEPENYSKKSIEEIYEKYTAYASKINKNRNEELDTNIIFVMNETFSDPLQLNGISSNKDPLLNFRDIQENSLNGKVFSPTLGGGTSTNEFQALTGLSMETYNSQITTPYVQVTSAISQYPSIVDKMNAKDYKTTAIHAYTPTFYKRNEVYTNLKFDEFRHRDNMKYTELVSARHKYISDFSAYQEVFDVIESSNNKDFIHLVTMQNHKSYAKKYKTVNYKVRGSGNEDEANAYFMDLGNSDISLRLLINKIDSFSEPVLLVFWGDHLPGFYKGDVFEDNDYQKLRETPLLVYSNNIELESEIDVISPIYLSNYVSRILNDKITPYEALLLEMENKIPVFEKGFYIERNHTVPKSSRDDLTPETLEVIEDYTLIMYDITTGKNYSKQFDFY